MATETARAPKPNTTAAKASAGLQPSPTPGVMQTMAQVHQMIHRVTYSECTVGDHVYYGRYLDLLETARGEFLRSIGFPLLNLQNADTAFPVVECHLKYYSPARYDDLLTVETWIRALQRVRLTFAHQIVGPKGQRILEAETLHACTSLGEKPKRLPEDLRASLTPWLTARP